MKWLCWSLSKQALNIEKLHINNTNKYSLHYIWGSSSKPSKDVATPLKFFTTNLCRSSPAQMGYMKILTNKHMPAPTAMRINLYKAVEKKSLVVLPDTNTIQNVNKNTRKPYSYVFIAGSNFTKLAQNPAHHKSRIINPNFFLLWTNIVNKHKSLRNLLFLTPANDDEYLIIS